MKPSDANRPSDRLYGIVTAANGGRRKSQPMKHRILPLFAMLIATLLFIAPGFAQVDPARLVAKVNGEEIRGEEYYRRMEFLPGVGKVMGNRLTEFPPGFLTLEQLITERLVMQLAREKGVQPSDLEVQAEIRNRIEEEPQYLENWKAGGRTEDELRSQVRIELAQFKLQTFGITVTDQQVEQQYNQNPQQYTIPRRFTLRVIVVDGEAARKQVDDDLAAGKKFADVARERSIDVSKSVGGEFGTLPITTFQPAMREALQGVPSGQLTKWITSNEPGATRSVRFLVESILPETKIPLTPVLRRQIRREMLVQRGRVRNNVQEEMRKKRAAAKIDITQPEFARAYRAFIDAYLRQSGTTTEGGN
jgi:foldase protein PrsA